GASEPVAVQVVAMPPSPLKQLQTWLGPVIAPLTTGGLVVVLVIFILLQREDLRWRIVQLFGRVHLQLTTEALDDAARRVGKYLRMQAFINSCYGAALAGGLLLIGLPNAALWGILGGLLRFLPYVGPWVAAAMPLTVS